MLSLRTYVYFRFFFRYVFCFACEDLWQMLGLGARLFVKVPRPGDSEVTFLVFESSCHLLLGCRQLGAGGPWPPWIFKYGTNIVDRGLKCYFSAFLLFFGLFFIAPSPHLDEAK